MLKGICAVSLSMLLAACGGSDPTPLAGVATLAYESRALDPWHPVDLRPTVTGLVGAATTFQAEGLPPGWELDAATGHIQGPALEPGRQLAFTVTLSADGHAGSLDARGEVNFNTLAGSIAMDSGFVQTAPDTYAFFYVFPSQLTFRVAQKVAAAADPVPLPAGASVRYGLLESTLPLGDFPERQLNASLDEATGVLAVRAGKIGDYTFRWYADVSLAGVTRRYTSNVIQIGPTCSGPGPTRLWCQAGFQL